MGVSRMNYTKKNILLCLLGVFAVFTVRALEVIIPPLHFIDERVDELDKTNGVNKDLVVNLSLEGTAPYLVFSAFGNGFIQAPQSTADALGIGQNSHNEYVLYGFVVRKEYSWSIELKLLDVNSRTILSFFYGSDDAAHYDRMLRDISGKIIDFIDDYLKLDLENRPGVKKYMFLRLPFSLGYWTPVESVFGEALVGTVKVSGGVELIPFDKVFFLERKNWFVGYDVFLDYKYGFGAPESYPVNLHSISLSFPVKVFCQLNDSSEIFFGTGPVFAIDIMQIMEKYKAPAVGIYHTLGWKCLFGYRYQLSEKLGLFINSEMEARGYNPVLVSFSPSIGITHTLISKEVP